MMKDGTSFVIKVNFNGDLRRVALSAAPSFAQLVENLNQLFPGFQPLHHLIQYEDEDGDRINITSDIELSEAVHCSLQEKAKVLRLFIVSSANMSPPLSHISNMQTSPSIESNSGSRPQTFVSFAQMMNANSNIMNNLLPQFFQVLNSMSSPPAEPQLPSQNVWTNQSQQTQPSQPQFPDPTQLFQKFSNVMNEMPREQLAQVVSHLLTTPTLQQMLSQMLQTFASQSAAMNQNSNAQDTRSNNLRSSLIESSDRPDLLARLVEDVTWKDGSIILASTPFKKTWKLQNHGSLTWPEGTKLIWVGGDPLGNKVEVPIPSTSSTKDVEVSVDLVSPSVPGRYVSYFRLSCREGEKFGHRIWIDLTVQERPIELRTEETSATPMSKRKKEKEEPKTLEEKKEDNSKKREAMEESLSGLAEMGFHDRELNTKLLTENSGDLLKVVQHLLATELD